MGAVLRVPDFDFYLINGERVPVYKGYISTHRMPKGSMELRAYHSWLGQRRRCTNPRREAFPKYGGRGIRVKYSSREFISWWLFQCSKKEYAIPTAGRIDHDGDYEFSNVRIEEKSENSREMIFRNRGSGACPAPKRTAVISGGDVIAICESCAAAARITGVGPASVSLVALGERSQSGGFRFEYVD